ncbi:MAG: pentapeptide repeat-containing protein [Gloeomargaritaceae cyanobacterium C42_A2020_066]|nr:pentapeptide repeat-containing protein [Gloeomargaritaceae cyanobacterium C42_A2020_066]
MGSQLQSSELLPGEMGALEAIVVNSDLPIQQQTGYRAEDIDVLIALVKRGADLESRFQAWETLNKLEDMHGRSMPMRPLRNVGGAVGLKEKYAQGERDFRFADLRGTELNRINLRGADLTGASLSGADLSESVLCGADLHSADLRGTVLYKANLTSVNLTRADLSGAYLIEANLYGVNLERANIKSANIEKCENLPRKWKLVWEIFNEQNPYHRSSFGKPERVLTGADLCNADLRGADLVSSKLDKSNLSEADLSSANLHGADLSGANLSAANLSGANLSKANLQGANLSRANFNGANLSAANLTEVNLSFAKLYGAKVDNQAARMSV